MKVFLTLSNSVRISTNITPPRQPSPSSNGRLLPVWGVTPAGRAAGNAHLEQGAA